LEEKKKDQGASKIYAVRTTVGQEQSVIEMIAAKVYKRQADVRSLLAPLTLKGYVFVEAVDEGAVGEAIMGVPHVRGIVEGDISLKEIEHFLEPKPAVTGLEKGDIIELIAGPFKGERARVIRLDKVKEEITIELLEATVPIPVTVRGDHVRVVQKGEV